MADARAIDAGFAAAVEALEATAAMPAYALQEVLEHCVKRFRERFDELACALCIEAGKPIKDARGEVTRLIDEVLAISQSSVKVKCIEKHDEWEQWIDPALITDVIS